MTLLRGISDTINMLDKYNWDYKYDYNTNTYEVPDDQFEATLETVKNKNYLLKLKVGNGSTWYNGSRNSLLASETIANDEEIVFTPSAVLDLLSQIEELKDFDLNLVESLDGILQLQVGDSFYELQPSDVVADVAVDDEVIEEISHVNEDAFNDLIDNDLDVVESIQSGIIKETLKTLLIGGIVRLGKNYLTK